MVRHGHRTEKDTRGAAYHSTISRKQEERRMPIDRQRDCAVEGYSQRVGIEIRDVLCLSCPVRQQYEIRLKEKGEKARRRSSEPLQSFSL